MFLLWLWYMMSWIGAVVMTRLCWRALGPLTSQIHRAARHNSSGTWQHKLPLFSSEECNVPQTAAFHTGLSQKEAAFLKTRTGLRPKQSGHSTGHPGHGTGHLDHKSGRLGHRSGHPHSHRHQPQPRQAAAHEADEHHWTMRGESILSAGEADYRY